MENKREPLSGKTFTELQEVCKGLNMPAFTGKQIARWLYKKKISSVDEMTDISFKNRELLKEKYVVGVYPPEHRQQSADGTVKYLFRTENGHCVESVYIPDENRATLCISSQVGCKMNCLFCMTGKQGFSGNLTSTEILNQIHSIPESDKLTNVVFMGMGEPLDNTEELFRSLEILTSDYGYAWSPKRITVSTIGILPGLKEFIENNDCHLAVSLHSPFHDERRELMPVEKVWPLKEVLNVIRKYDFSHQRRVSFEYILFKGQNDSLQHAEALVKLLRNISCRVNLIRFHAIPEVNLQSSEEKTFLQFRDYLNKKGIICTIRASRGEDILAACGMLSTREKGRNTGQKSNI